MASAHSGCWMDKLPKAVPVKTGATDGTRTDHRLG